MILPPSDSPLPPSDSRVNYLIMNGAAASTLQTTIGCLRPTPHLTHATLASHKGKLEHFVPTLAHACACELSHCSGQQANVTMVATIRCSCEHTWNVDVFQHGHAFEPPCEHHMQGREERREGSLRTVDSCMPSSSKIMCRSWPSGCPSGS